MARVQATRVESEDVHSAVSWNHADLPKKAPSLDWTALLDAAGLNDSLSKSHGHSDRILIQKNACETQD